MGPSPDKSTMHVVEGHPWKEAAITVLEPRSPYRPWRADEFDRIKDGDRVVALLDTDPVSVLATVGFVGADGDVHTTLAGIERFELGGSPALLELDTLNMVSSVRLPASAGMLHRDEFAVMRRLTDCWSDGMDGCFGSSTLAQARTLLASGGRCTGCEQQLDLTGPQATDRVHFHTASRPVPGPDGGRQYVDWSAVLCDPCQTRMVDGYFENFIAYRFSLAPNCPACSAGRSMSTDFGEPAAGYILKPWTTHMGCELVPVEWECGECGHQWASPERLARWSKLSE
jgi:hypothetical protein